jgi:hypothetical protein
MPGIKKESMFNQGRSRVTVKFNPSRPAFPFGPDRDKHQKRRHGATTHTFPPWP